MEALDTILKERYVTHGDFSVQSKCSQDLKSVMYKTKNWSTLKEIQREGLEMIQHKIARILSGDPNEKDHYNDIAGYASLIAQSLE